MHNNYSLAQGAIRGRVREVRGTFSEEERSRQNSIFSVVRALTALFHHDKEPQLGLYGSFGYDITFQFEPVRLHQQRDPKQRDPRRQHLPCAEVRVSVAARCCQLLPAGADSPPDS